MLPGFTVLSRGCGWGHRGLPLLCSYSMTPSSGIACRPMRSITWNNFINFIVTLSFWLKGILLSWLTYIHTILSSKLMTAISRLLCIRRSFQRINSRRRFLTFFLFKYCLMPWWVYWELCTVSYWNKRYLFPSIDFVLSLPNTFRYTRTPNYVSIFLKVRSGIITWHVCTWSPPAARGRCFS